jgi:hypothetical protein
MSKATNDQDYAAAYQRAEARKEAKANLSPQDTAFLNALKQRWFPLGKTEDYQIVERLLIESRVAK